MNREMGSSVSEMPGGECATFAGELTRVAFGELRIGAASAALNEHVRRCCTCAELLRDAITLLPTLEDALRPEALSPTLVARVSTAIGPRARPAQARVLRLSAWRGPLAAAAALALFFVFPPAGNDRSGGTRRSGAAPTAELTPVDAADIATAFGLVQWADVTELSLATAASAVTELEQSLDREGEAQTLLPWSPAEDWDLPPTPAGTHVEPAASMRGYVLRISALDLSTRLAQTRRS